MVCFRSFHVSQATAPQNVFTGKLTIYQLNIDFITKEGKDIIKWGSSDMLQTRASDITKSGKYYTSCEISR